MLKVTIIWKGKNYDEEYSENDSVADVIKTFLKSHGKDELPELSHYHMFLLNDPPRILDTSKQLKQITDLMKHDYFLLLTKSSQHIETKRDLKVATILAAYTAVLFSVAMWVLISLWPKTQLDYNRTTARIVSIAGTGTSFSIGPETLLLIAMILSGVIGACVFSAFAISHHLGPYHDFNQSWTAWYLLRPFVGAGLAVIINLLIRSSVFTVGSGTNIPNIVGLSGIAALAGLFSEDAVRKLNDIADELFGKVAPKKENQASTNSAS
jgi:hypothetical protein